MTKHCRFCNKEHTLPEPGQSNNDMVWENKKDRRSGGLHYCRSNRSAKKKATWDNFYQRKQLRCVVSRAITQKLKRHGGSKNGSILKNLNYSMDDLKNHLESKFKDGMSWDNYGEWHIDHKIPDSHFTYDKMNDEQFKLSWSLENLQPMWAIDNQRKYNKLIGYSNQILGLK